MANIERVPGEASGDNNGTEVERILGRMGEFNPKTAEQARNEYIEEHTDQDGRERVDQSEIEDAEKSAVHAIDYAIFDRLSAKDFGTLSSEQQREIVEQCEATLDASIEDFAKLGSFADPELGRYNGQHVHEGIDGAKRGVRHIVNCAIEAERLQSEITAVETELAKYKGAYALLYRKRKAQLESKLSQLRQDQKRNTDWVEHIGGLAFQDPAEKQKYKEKIKGAEIVGGFGSEGYVKRLRREGKKAFTDEERKELERPVIEGSLKVFHSEEIQSKFQHLVQMQKAIIKAKYHRNN